MGGIFGGAKPPPAPVAPSASDKEIQDQARAERSRRANAQGRGSTILTGSETETSAPGALRRTTLLGG